MKLYRVTVVLAVLLLSWTTLKAVADQTDYSQCNPYCVIFKQIGDGHYAIAVDAYGRFATMAPVEGMAGPALTGARLDPWHPWDSFPETFAADGCSSKTSTVQYTTESHHVTVITTETWCDGKLIDVTVTTIRVPVPQAPVDN